MSFLKNICGKKAEASLTIDPSSVPQDAEKKGCMNGLKVSFLNKFCSKKTAMDSGPLKKYFASNKTKAATITVATLITLVVLGAIAAVLYAKFGHNATIEGWMNNKFLPLFTDKLAPALTKAIDWMKQGGQIPNWVTVALGATTVVSASTLLGLIIKHVDDARTQRLMKSEEKTA